MGLKDTFKTAAKAPAALAASGERIGEMLAIITIAVVIIMIFTATILLKG